MPFLEILDLSNNKLESLGQLPGALVARGTRLPGLTKLHTLKLENNGLRDIPYEFGMACNLKILLLEGNPQRTVRAAVLRQGHESVLKYLQMKVPQGYVPTPTVDAGDATFAKQQPQKQSVMMDPDRTTHNPPQNTHNPNNNSRTPAEATAGSNGESLAIRQLTAQLEDLQIQFDANATSMSNAKKHAMKKQLQMKKAELIRERRKPTNANFAPVYG